jgi:hypothetical protein
MTNASPLTLPPPVFPFEWAGSWGEDRYGVFQEFMVEKVTQRMRGIPPDPNRPQRVRSCNPDSSEIYYSEPFGCLIGERGVYEH